MYDRERKVMVIGHKNPDTDSICSAIAYASLKNKLDGDNYVAMRAGAVNEETEYVLKYFGIAQPELIEDVSTQVMDVEMRKFAGVENGISLKKAWNLMKELGVVTLPVTKKNKLEGLITVGDITNAYMDIYDSRILGVAKTTYSNVVDTIDGNMVTGDENDCVAQGKVLIAAATPDMMESYIDKDDIVILGNRYESQLCAIEMDASCIIVCEGAPLTMTIKKLASERNCAIISSPHDAYTVARLINQSMPIKYFMHKDHLITFDIDEGTEAIKDIMAKKRYRDFPVLDVDGNYVGMISRRNLLDMQRKKIIMVDHNEKMQAVEGIENADIQEIIDHHRLGSIKTMGPVFFRNQALGCTATIITQMYEENNTAIDKKTAGLLCAAILSDTLMFKSPTCTQIDELTAQKLALTAQIDIRTFAKEMFSAGSNLSGKLPEEIFYQDFKRFEIGDMNIGVGQINSMNSDELEVIKKRLSDYINENFDKMGQNMIFFMLTDIIDTNTELIFFGENSKTFVEEAFDVKIESDSCVLPGVVSRKKQMIPKLMRAAEK